MKQLIKVKCTVCKRNYYASEQELEDVLPEGIEVGDFFETGCPICQADGYAELIQNGDESGVQPEEE